MPNASTEKSRLLIIHPALPPYRLHLFNALAERCHLKLIFLRQNLLNQKFDQATLVAQLTADHVYLTRGITLLKRTLRFGIRAEIARFKPDVVVTHEFSPVTVAVAIQRLFRNNSFRHVVWTDDNPESISCDTLVRRLLRRFIFPRIDGLICLNQEAVLLYQSRFNAMLPLGICPILHEETIFCDSIARAKPAARKLIGIHQLEGKRILLFVGRLVTEKRIDRLLHAFSQLYDSFADICMVLVGDGPQRERLQELAEELGVADHVIFAGRVEGEQLYAWYCLGGLFVLASEFERFGAVVNEALLSGMPVVCSNKAGASALIQEGVNGTVVDASNSTELRSAILNFLQRIAPLSISDLAQSRPSLMTTSFNKSVDGFLSAVNISLKKGRLPYDAFNG